MKIATIDFEASSMTGYPIEVGIAIHTPERPYLSVWSSLIKPEIAWLQNMHWDQVSAQIHGIARSQLKHAPSAWDVAHQLNELLRDIGIAYCDGWRFDHRWLFLLMKACPEKCAFELRDLSALDRMLGIPPSSLFEDKNYPTEHRAGADAKRLLQRTLCLSNQAKLTQ